MHQHQNNPGCKHEMKTCPRCLAVFECKVGDITKCQCFAVQLNDAGRELIARTYSDCLCAACMALVKAG